MSWRCHVPLPRQSQHRKPARTIVRLLSLLSARHYGIIRASTPTNGEGEAGTTPVERKTDESNDTDTEIYRRGGHGPLRACGACSGAAVGMVRMADRTGERTDRHPAQEDRQEPTTRRDPRSRPRIPGHTGGGSSGRPPLPQSVDVGMAVREGRGHPSRQVRRARAQIRQGSPARRNHRPRRDARNTARRARHRQAPHQPVRLRDKAL